MGIHIYTRVLTSTQGYSPLHVGTHLYIWVLTSTYGYSLLHMGTHIYTRVLTSTYRYSPLHMGTHLYIRVSRSTARYSDTWSPWIPCNRSRTRSWPLSWPWRDPFLISWRSLPVQGLGIHPLQLKAILLERCKIFTVHNKGNVFTSVYHSFCPQGRGVHREAGHAWPR